MLLPLNIAGYTPLLMSIFFAAVLAILAAISLVDAQTREIPNRLSAALFVCGIVGVFIMPEISLASRLLGMFCVSLPLLFITLIAPGSFGGGDIKLMFAAGLLLGWQNILLAGSIGVFLGGLYGAYLLLFQKCSKQERFAFGPALCAGIASAFLFGTPLISWYLGA